MYFKMAGISIRRNIKEIQLHKFEHQLNLDSDEESDLHQTQNENEVYQNEKCSLHFLFLLAC